MLPQPSDEFRWVQAGPAAALVCRALEPFADHLFTTRQWALGASESGNTAAWRQVAAALDLDPARLVRVRQVHGAEVLVKRRGEPTPQAPDAPGVADIVVSNDPQLALAVQTADCVPLLFADRRVGVVAAAHAGWRGLAQRVPEATVDRLAREFGSRPADLMIAAGPSIGACCYEIGKDVRERFVQAGFTSRQITRWFLQSPRVDPRNPSLPRLPSPPRPDHWYFDSAAAARDQLEAAGVPGRQIFTSGLCTASHAETLCSYRRDGAPAGRMAAVIKPQLST